MESQKTNAALFLKPCKLKWVNLISTIAKSPQQFMYKKSPCLLLCRTLRKISRDIHLQTRKIYFGLPLPPLVLSEDASSQTSGNFNWLLSELRNWDDSLLQLTTVFFFCFHKTASYSMPDCFPDISLTELTYCQDSQTGPMRWSNLPTQPLNCDSSQGSFKGETGVQPNPLWLH